MASRTLTHLMNENTHQQLEALSSHLATRREQILKAWRVASDADWKQTTMESLTRSQFYDHIPQVLDVLEEKLRSRPGGVREAAAEVEEKQEEGKHGLVRWQQGYRLREVTREWGYLHMCLTRELEVFAISNPGIHSATVTEAQCRMITLVNNAISESVSQYLKMEKETAAGRARDLEQALAEISEMERQRGLLIREAVHDLGGSILAVTSAASTLSHASLPEERREMVKETISRGVRSLRTMLGELMSLARLEAGQEGRQVTKLDVAELLEELCDGSRITAQEQGLWLEVNGPRPLEVETDSDKVFRIVQNLLQNALRYTEQGGVQMSWGREGSGHWWVMVKDTGPGLVSTPKTPILKGLKDATALARENQGEEVQAASKNVQKLPQTGVAGISKQKQLRGEGIGLAIVKRLCDLLDANLEVASSPKEGTSFRVLLPVRYEP